MLSIFSVFFMVSVFSLILLFSVSSEMHILLLSDKLGQDSIHIPLYSYG